MTMTEQTEHIIEINHLVKRFGDNVILNDLTLNVSKGEVVVLIGPSGCGKSTLLRCLNGLEPIQGGSVTLHGEPVEHGKPSLYNVRQKIGMVFQSYDLFPHMTVMKNITLAPLKVQSRSKEEVTEKAMELLKRVGLEDKANSYPSELSGGQKQRVAIVRSLIMNPDIMLLDEITAALDPEMVHEVLNVVLELAKGSSRTLLSQDQKSGTDAAQPSLGATTMMIVTHEMAFAEAVADRIVFLDGGVIVEEGAPAEFFHHPKTERAQRFLKTFTYSR